MQKITDPTEPEHNLRAIVYKAPWRINLKVSSKYGRYLPSCSTLVLTRSASSFCSSCCTSILGIPDTKNKLTPFMLSAHNNKQQRSCFFCIAVCRIRAFFSERIQVLDPVRPNHNLKISRPRVFLFFSKNLFQMPSSIKTFHAPASRRCIEHSRGNSQLI